MASSSSAPPLEPRLYEVFLSFRGVNTRLNFLSHLRGALKRRGIITFYDDDSLRIGQDLSTELVEAIQKSSIAIVVFSQDYASSTWCLKELVKIVECKNEGKLEIYPIFYHVEPTDVRKQTKSFSEAFKNHEVNFKDNKEMVNAWRKALTKVSDLKGVDVREKDEASFIETIAHEIVWKLPREASPLTESLVGMESRISDLKILINKNPDEVRLIGFWGMGGVGKTTTARAIFEECEREFEGSCFLGDVRRRKKKMEKLQQQLLDEVMKCKDERIYDVGNGSSIIRRRMCHKRVLLVLDDVDDIEQQKVLAGERSWFGKGSRIIITTRDEHLLNDVHDKYVVDTLNVKDALFLFRNHAFKTECPDENYKKLSEENSMKLSQEVLRYAGGLPLALKVLGEHLRRQEETFWLATIRRLKDVPQQKIISILQISFDEGLTRREQDIFLYIACFFRGENRDGVMKSLNALCLYPEEGIRILIQKSLIHETLLESFGLCRKSFGMHDLLQDMGRHIVRERANEEVRRYSHLWLGNDTRKVLLSYMGAAEAEGIVIDGDDDAIESEFVKEDSFMHMNKLKFLQIRGLGRAEANVFQSSVQLPSELRWLDWNNYPGKGLVIRPSINLVHLQMPDSLIESTPDFSHMPHLEALDLSFSKNLVDIHPSLGRHTKIRRINLECCGNLKEFPAIIRMKSLEYLNLYLTGLQTFPEIRGNVDSLKELSLEKTRIKGLPIPTKCVTGLRNLKLGWKDDETTELGSLSSFEHLDCFCVEDFFCLTTVPQLPSSLQILEMIGCPALMKYPNSFPSTLRRMKITGSSIEKTPDFSQLPNLLELDLSGSDQLSEVHASLGIHEKIERIYLSRCFNLYVFPTIVDMGCLESLDLSFTKLQCFPEITGKVDNLANLNLAGTSIRTLPESIGRATGLKNLDLTSCRYFVSLPISLQRHQKRRKQVTVKE